jgi:hypothetical protein
MKQLITYFRRRMAAQHRKERINANRKKIAQALGRM